MSILSCFKVRKQYWMNQDDGSKKTEENLHNREKCHKNRLEILAKLYKRVELYPKF